MQTYDTPEKNTPAKKMGRPRKKVKGKMMWIPAELVDFIETYLELTKQKAQESVNHDNA
jgi:hypothetical protein